MRVHSYQISVLAGPKRNLPEEVGGVVIYRVEENIAIHLWAIAGIGDDYVTVEQRLRSMIDQMDVIVRLSATVASGIQFIRLAPGGTPDDLLERQLVFHRVYSVTAIYYRTEGVTVPPILGPFWNTPPFVWDDVLNPVSLWS